MAYGAHVLEVNSPNSWSVVWAFGEMVVEENTVAGTGERGKPHQTGSHRAIRVSGWASWSNMCLCFILPNVILSETAPH